MNAKKRIGPAVGVCLLLLVTVPYVMPTIRVGNVTSSYTSSLSYENSKADGLGSLSHHRACSNPEIQLKSPDVLANAPPSERITRWKVVKTNYTEADIANISSYCLLSPSRIKERRGDSLVLVGESECLILRGSSNTILYETDRQYREEVNLPDHKAKSIADDFLEEHGLMPPDAYFYKVMPGVVMKKISKDNSSVLERKIFGLRVLYERKLDNIPVRGPGSEIVVTLGTDGNITGFRRIWREIEPYDEVEIISEADAFDRFRNGELLNTERFPPCDRIIGDDIMLIYYTGPWFEDPGIISPAYQIKATTVTEGVRGGVQESLFVGYVDATK